MGKSKAMDNAEVRQFAAGIEVRGGEDKDGNRKVAVIGHAAVFNQLSRDLGGFQEIIAPGAFARSLAGGEDVYADWNHNSDMILGRRSAGTLELGEDERGLAVTIYPPDTQWAKDHLVTMSRGDVTQMSFVFQVRPGGQRWDQTDVGEVRTLTDVKLIAVSPVADPAYPQTDVGVALRSRDAWRRAIGQSEAEREEIERTIAEAESAIYVAELGRLVNS